MNIAHYTFRLALFGYRMWVALLGQRRAIKLMIVGAVLSTVAAVVLQVTT